ncbi:MAG: hypothetical protein H7X86_02740 [Gorillibacterium sp.]|nr:hypothetical protein [Gorillibacterium sp.]
MRWLVYIIFAVIYLLITFFGIGPVLMADGSNQERIITLLIVLVIYVLVTLALRFIIKKMDRN